MPTDHSRKTQIRAAMAARGLSYTAAMRTLDAPAPPVPTTFGQMYLSSVSTTFSILGTLEDGQEMAMEWHNGNVSLYGTGWESGGLYAYASCTSARTQWAKAHLRVPFDETQAAPRIAAMRTVLHAAARMNLDARMARAVSKATSFLAEAHPQTIPGTFKLAGPLEVTRVLSARGSFEVDGDHCSATVAGYPDRIMATVVVTTREGREATSFRLDRNPGRRGPGVLQATGDSRNTPRAAACLRAYLKDRLQTDEDGREMCRDFRALLAGLAMPGLIPDTYTQ